MWARRSPKGQAKSRCKALQSHHLFPHTDLRGQPTPKPPQRDDTPIHFPLVPQERNCRCFAEAFQGEFTRSEADGGLKL
ncbi:hypothetical protein KUCAC02_014417 [Chaenocephalus aceratus]|uniref:Uncharacterized protein n=1 Tax=Chaenocephalus aceratus TaxID=36190 RepID=A0ACB9WDZ1_CHAAC|nr:hypothetical protein KUCAC02_014417 [Chaenocephalus aceratus]